MSILYKSSLPDALKTLLSGLVEFIVIFLGDMLQAHGLPIPLQARIFAQIGLQLSSSLLRVAALLTDVAC